MEDGAWRQHVADYENLTYCCPGEEDFFILLKYTKGSTVQSAPSWVVRFGEWGKGEPLPRPHNVSILPSLALWHVCYRFLLLLHEL